jgi:hypothetical protein
VSVAFTVTERHRIMPSSRRASRVSHQFAAITYAGAQLDQPPPLGNDAILMRLVAGLVTTRSMPLGERAAIGIPERARQESNLRPSVLVDRSRVRSNPRV